MTTSTETPEQALARIQSMGFGKNDALAVMAFADCGIDPEQITPRVNVLTFRAWKAKGRQVAKGATSVRVVVWIPCKDTKSKDGESKKRLRPKTCFLFHESQTIPTGAAKGTRPAAWNNPALVKPGTYEAEPQCHDASTVLVDEHGMSEADNVKAWTDSTPGDVIEREMCAAISAPDTSSVAAIERSAQDCKCPMAGVITNVDCPIHGGR